MSRSLERRYRRLLRWYPAAYRAANEHEMLGVLLDCAAADQRRPTAREHVDLLRGALRCRIALLGRAYDGDRWRDALGLVALPIVAPLCLLRLRGLTGPTIGSLPDPTIIAPAVLWTLALISLLLRPQWLRVVAGLAAFAGTVALVGLSTYRGYAPLIGSVNILVLEAALALCLTLAHGGRRLWHALGRPRTRLLAAVAAGAVLFEVVNQLPVAMPVPSNSIELLWLAAAILLAVGRSNPVRRRLWVLLAGLAVFGLTFYREMLPITDNDRTHIELVMWLVPGLALITVLAGAHWLRRREAQRQARSVGVVARQ